MTRKTRDTARRTPSGRRRALAATTAVALAATGLFAVTTANAGHGNAELPGSNFEIDDDANLKNDDGDPKVDWADLAHPDGPELRATDEPTGQNDDSYKGGVKEDTECPAETTGSIPNNKSDLLTFHVYEEEGDPGFLNLAWSRVSDPSGTTLMDFEFNQSTTACPQGPNVLRTDGDLLIEYAIDQGGARANISGRFWDGPAGEWGPSVDLDQPSAECGGNPCAVGTINNESVIPAAESDGLGEKQERTFGEAQIDLDLIFDDEQCTSFGSAMLKSRSSDSFTSQLKDFIRPVPIDLQNCGNVIIRKQTLPDEDPNETVFGFTKSFPTDPENGDTFTLTDDGVQDFNDTVLFGTGYTVDETTVPTPGWVFNDVDCSASTGVNYTINGSLVTFDIDSDSDVLDCTYTNRALAKFTVKKILDPSDSTETFDFTPGGNLPAGNFSLGHGDTKEYENLNIGDVSVTEDDSDPAWDLVDVTCTPNTNSGTNPTATVTLAAGDDVTCTFTNRQRANIVIIKVDDTGAPLVGFQFTATAAGQPDASCTTALVDHDNNAETPDRAQCTLENLVPSVEYTVTEVLEGRPAGYGTDPDDPKTVTPGPGKTVELTFENPRLFRVIAYICQESDNTLYTGSADVNSLGAKATVGDVPQEVQDLLDAGVTLEQIEAALCSLGANFGGLTANNPGESYSGSVTIPK